MQILKIKNLNLTPFLSLSLSPPCAEDQNMETVMKLLDQQYAPLNMVGMISRYGTEQQGANARDAELLTRERLCRALSMFELVMQRIKSFLVSDVVSISMYSYICITMAKF